MRQKVLDVAVPDPMVATGFDRGLHDLFEEEVCRRPDDQAVSHNDESWTYATLNRRANGIARTLASAGVNTGDTIAVLLDTSPVQVAALFGILKAGCNFVCLGPGYPEARLVEIIEASQPVAILTDLHLLATMPSVIRAVGQSSVIFVNPAQPVNGALSDSDIHFVHEVSARDDENPSIEISPDDIAYTVYTSGSTGKPKGILQSHRSFLQFITAQRSVFEIEPGQRLAQWASIAYDASYCEIFGTLCFGATLCLADEDERYNPVDLARWVRRESITILQMVPSFARQLLPVVSANGDRDFLASVKKWFLAGEILSPDLANDLVALGPRVFNLYGPTETVLATWHEVTEHITATAVPIGKPFDGREILLLDEQQVPVAEGSEGEIYVRSPFLTSGYAGNEEETRKRFIQNPLHDQYPDPVYRTGDTARRREDGTLLFGTRIDRLIKLRGNRVEPGDIESALRRCPGVTDCVVTVKRTNASVDKLTAKAREAREHVGSFSHKAPEPSGAQVLAAYFIADEHVPVSTLRQFATRQLPPHMVPQWFVQLQEFPLNANRKLDVKALPDPARIRPNLDMAYRAPESELEKTIVGIFEEVLGITGVGVDDDFFDLGGESLLSMQVLNRIREETGQALSFRDFFANKSIADLSDHLQTSTQKGDSIAGQDHPADGVYPLSHSQRGLWFLWKRDPNNPYYSAQNSIHLRGDISVPVLKESWKRVLQRHSNLCATFGMRDSEPVQRFNDARGFELPLIDLSHLSAREAEEKMAWINRADVAIPFDLDKDLLFKTKLFKVDQSSYELVTTYHEILVDLWGFAILIRDLGEIYDALHRNAEPNLEPLKVTFGDYVLWEKDHIRKDLLTREENFWKEYLAGEIPSLNLPTDRPASSNHDHTGASVSTMLDSELVSAIKEQTRKSGTTLFVFLLSAFQLLLHRYSSQSQVIVGAPLATRDNEGLEEIASWFLNMLPIRTHFSGDRSFRDLLAGVKDDVTSALTNAHYPFMWMLDLADVGRSDDQDPIFRVMFNWQNLPQKTLNFDSIQISSSEVDSGYKKYDLALYAQEHRDQIYLHFAYLSALFDKATVQRILNNFVVMLKEIVADPEGRIHSFEYMTADERSFLLDDLNATDAPIGMGQCIDKLFDASVTKYRDQPAYHFGNDTITFGELASRANQLANYLIKQGAGKGQVVALHLERSFEMVVAVLAVLKSGSAYVALDPSYPESRLLEIVRDTSPTCLVTDDSVAAIETGDLRRVNVVHDRVAIAQESEKTPEITRTADDTLNIVYTSSSTGKPKGVVVPERAVLNRLHWMWREYPFSDGDVTVLQKSYALVAATWEIFGGLLKGIPTVILSHEESRDASLLWRRLTQAGVSHVLSSPPFIELLLTAAEETGESWSSLRFATTSAEPISPDLVKRWYHVFPDVPLYNLYGATECSSNVTAFDTRKLGADDARVPIGYPLSNCRVYITNDDLDLVPHGATGELSVSGSCVADGYWEMPDMTEQRFVRSPFRDEGTTLYRTGDVARVRNDGAVELLGRTDRQVKIRGYRIDLDGVQTVINRYTSVESSAVVCSEANGQRRLAAFVVPSDGFQAASLRKYLEEYVPDYMIPAAINTIDSLPLTANGKLNYRGLPKPDFGAEIGKGASSKPRTDTEKGLARIWQKVLKIDSVGIDDNFFSIGGDSLLAVRMVTDIKNTFDVELRIAELFRRPTVRTLAEAIDDRSLVEFESIVELAQSNPGFPPVFCFHGTGSNVMNYHALAQELSDEFRVLGVQGPGLDGHPIKSFSLEKLAAFFADEIVRTYPQGPYHLLGFCRGGLTAIEVARQLREQNRPVGSVVVIDLLTTKVKQAMRKKENAWKRQNLNLPTRLCNHFIFRKKYAGIAANILMCRLHQRLGRPSPLRSRNTYVEHINVRRFDQHEPKRYAGNVDIICTTQWRSHDPTLGWDHYVDGTIRVESMEGEHLDLLTYPLVERVANVARNIFER